MSSKEIIIRYHLIIQKLRTGPASFKEIQDFLIFQSELQGYSFEISKRTFHRLLNDIRSLYNIDIQYSKTLRKYIIEYEEENDYTSRLMEAFDTFNLLNVSQDLLKYINLEKRKPKGTGYLTPILKAIKNKYRVTFNYQKFNDSSETKRKIEPLGLKEFRNRWYLLGLDSKDLQIKNFGVDRLNDFEVTKERFKKPENFDLKAYYKHSFGVNRPVDGKPKKIVLSFSPFQGKYIKTLPLHPSQEIEIDSTEELRVSIYVYPTYDLWMELRSMGDDVKIIEPKNLKEMALNNY